MAKFNRIQNNFLAGEISPKSFGRTDIREYQEGLEELTNFIVQKQGGATKRPGAQFVKDNFAGTDIADGSRLFEFIFSRTESYILVIQPDDNIPKIFNTTQLIESEVSKPSTGFFVLTWDGYTEDELKEVQFTQTGDVLVLSHPKHPPQFISRTEENTFTVRDYNNPATLGTKTFTELFAYKDLNITSTTLTTSATSGIGIGLTSSAVIFESDHVGSVWALTDSGTTGSFVITAVASGVLATITILETLPAAATGGVTTWFEPAWSTIDGFPRSVTFFEQRIFYAGTETQPNTIWGSANGDVFFLTNEDSQLDTSSSVVNTDPFNFSIVSNEVNEFQWLIDGKNLSAGTRGREFIISGPDTTLGLGPLNISVSPETSHGSAYTQAIRSENIIVFVQRSGQIVREFVFNRDENSFRASDLTFLSEHMSKKSLELRSSFDDPAIESVKLQEADNGVIWMLDSNGFLFGTTRRRLNGVNAFHFHKIGGTFGSEQTFVQSIAVIPSNDGSHDDIYMLNKRTINGSSKIYMEKIGKEFILSSLDNTSNFIEDKPVYMDSCKYQRASEGFTLHSSFSSSTTADFSDGSTAPSFNQGDSIVGGELDLTGTTATVRYDLTGNDDTGQIGTIRAEFEFKSSPNSTGKVLLTTFSSPSPNDQISLSMTNKPFGTSAEELNLNVNDSTGTAIISERLGRIPVFDGQRFTLEIDYDFTAGDTRVYVNGEQFGRTFTDTLTRNSPDFLEIGGSGNYQLRCRDLALYDSRQNTKRHTPSRIFSPGTTIPNLDHLEGETVDVIADGLYVGQKTVSSGSITLDNSATDVIVGLRYDAVLKTLPPEAGSSIGSAQGEIKRNDRTVIRFHRTVGAKFGSAGEFRVNEEKLEEIIFRPPNIAMNAPIPLFTGDKVLQHPASSEESAQVIVKQELPFPCNVVSIINRGITYD